MPIPLPAWLDTLPESARPAARTKFLLKACAIYATEEGKIQDFSAILGFHRNTLFGIASGANPMTANTAVAIEKLLGRSIVTREMLLPELFEIPL